MGAPLNGNIVKMLESLDFEELKGADLLINKLLTVAGACEFKDGDDVLYTRSGETRSAKVIKTKPVNVDVQDTQDWKKRYTLKAKMLTKLKTAVYAPSGGGASSSTVSAPLAPPAPPKVFKEVVDTSSDSSSSSSDVETDGADQLSEEKLALMTEQMAAQQLEGDKLDAQMVELKKMSKMLMEQEDLKETTKGQLLAQIKMLEKKLEVMVPPLSAEAKEYKNKTKKNLMFMKMELEELEYITALEESLQ